MWNFLKLAFDNLALSGRSQGPACVWVFSKNAFINYIKKLLIRKMAKRGVKAIKIVEVLL